ncbi:acyl-CoA dehydrogenase family protein [Actinokineospora sp. PR83]|uniref:acyl-CoA dehydrogenase family protein n=1 Tax=Actinokineospora sp. PR83 TaxID=2884908 RepID=UPI0027DFBE30|nr:acyl-CoA dehydrogenase family protein [Actinokineospora sp. PR83]MCG8919187.1 acyl-CoA dehydrogenase family protein [Actinokineospora sp. PR83]
MIRTTAEQDALRGGLTPWLGVLNDEHVRQDERAEFPRAKWAALRRAGLLGLPFGERWGGLGRDLVTTMHVLEALGEGCRDGGLGFSVSTHMVSTGIALQRHGSAELKDRYLPGVCSGETIGAHAITESETGSDALRMRTRAVRDGDHFVLTGTKAFVSNGPIADLVVVYARTSGDSGPLGTTAFLVERGTEGLRFGPAQAKMGLRTSPLGALYLDGVRVPAANALGPVGGGFLVLDHVMKWEILCSFAITAGAIRHRLDRCLEHARSRRQFGAPIGSYQAVSHRLVDAEIGLRTARSWLYGTAERFAAGENVTEDVAIAKLVTSEVNVSSALTAVQVFGGAGYLADTGIERELRDAVGGTLYSGTSEIQRNRIAAMLGLG